MALFSRWPLNYNPISLHYELLQTHNIAIRRHCDWKRRSHLLSEIIQPMVPIYLSTSQERRREHSLPLWGNIFDDALTRHLSVGGTINPLAMAAVMIGWPLATSVEKVADLGCFSQFGIFLGHVTTFSLHFQYQNTQVFSFNNLYFWEWTGNIMIQFVIFRATQKRVMKFTLAPLSCQRSRTTNSDMSLFFHLTCNFPPLLLP